MAAAIDGWRRPTQRKAPVSLRKPGPLGSWNRRAVSSLRSSLPQVQFEGCGMEIVTGIAGSCVIVPLLMIDNPDNWNVAVPGIIST